MTQPLDRTSSLPALGEIDDDAGEFWVDNPFSIENAGENLSAYERNKTYLNVAGQGFIDASFASQADIESDSRSVVAADFNRDGAVDLLVASDGGGPLRLFLNRFPERGNSVTLRLIGQESNHQGIGSRVTAFCDSRQIVRDVFPANGFMGQGPSELVIGIQESDKIDRLTVRWPTGKLQEFFDLTANRAFAITEGNPEPDVFDSFEPPQ